MSAAAEFPASPQVLVVDDEEKTRDSLREALELEGCTVSTASDGADAARLMREIPFDLVILDWMLPDRDGIDVLRYVRQGGTATPVLMLTARTTLQDRVIGLDSGADDYLSKPFALAELLARCRALLRRPGAVAERILQCEDLTLDTRARIARRENEEIALTPREVDLLEFLLRHRGQNVSREMMEREVWKQTNRMTSLNNVIDVQMMRLRKKLDVDGKKRLIHTVRGIGYRLGEESA